MYAFPAWAVLLAMIGGLAALACGGHVLVRRSFPAADLIEHNEVAGFIYAVVGVVYAVVLGFLVVVVWEQYSDSDSRARVEAAALAQTWRFSAGLDEPDRSKLRGRLRAYVDAVVDREWPEMRHGGESRAAERDLTAVYTTALAARPASPAAANAHARLLDRLQTLADSRRRRLDDNESGVPGLLWGVLWIGAAVCIGFAYLFGLRNSRAQLLMTAGLAAMIASLFTVILEFDYPFRGDVAVSPAAFATVREQIARGALDDEAPLPRRANGAAWRPKQPRP